MELKDIVGFSTAVAIVIGAFWYLIRLLIREQICGERVKELERENDRLKNKNDSLKDTIMRLK